MTRISKNEHPRILHMVDVEQRRVSEVAASFGCTPANIYALLSKLRRGNVAAPERKAAGKPASASGAASTSASPRAPVPAAEPIAPVPAVDLFATGAIVARENAPEPQPGRADTPPGPAGVTAEPSTALAETAAPTTPRAGAGPATVTDLPRRKPQTVAERGSADSGNGANGVGARLAKPGFGLVMRTGDGEESLTPFRSLDDLLSAVKPILRAASRSPDAVWFSIQPLDLATLDIDAA